MRTEKHAKRFFVSGRVQGVGYRYLLRAFARELQRGPALASVTDIGEVEAEVLSDFSSAFSVNYDR